jgi:hypothetical protein
MRNRSTVSNAFILSVSATFLPTLHPAWSGRERRRRSVRRRPVSLDLYDLQTSKKKGGLLKRSAFDDFFKLEKTEGR